MLDSLPCSGCKVRDHRLLGSPVREMAGLVQGRGNVLGRLSLPRLVTPIPADRWLADPRSLAVGYRLVLPPGALNGPVQCLAETRRHLISSPSASAELVQVGVVRQPAGAVGSTTGKDRQGSAQPSSQAECQQMRACWFVNWLDAL